SNHLSGAILDSDQEVLAKLDSCIVLLLREAKRGKRLSQRRFEGWICFEKRRWYEVEVRQVSQRDYRDVDHAGHGNRGPVRDDAEVRLAVPVPFYSLFRFISHRLSLFPDYQLRACAAHSLRS